MTLDKRISGNLNGRIRSSTFRLTLAAILADPERLTTTGPGQLDRDSEQRLTQWMRTHLNAAVYAFSDRDATPGPRTARTGPTRSAAEPGRTTGDRHPRHSGR
jgi:GIY-YIG catalytic domain